MKAESLFEKADRLWRESTHDELDEKGRARRDFRAGCSHLIRKGERVELSTVLPEQGDPWLEPVCAKCAKYYAELGERYAHYDPETDR